MNIAITPSGISDSNLSNVRAGRYTIDPAHTRILFSVSHFGFSTFFGEFVRPWGAIEINPYEIEDTRFDVSVPVSNVHTLNAVLDGELTSEDWLDERKYPEILMKSRSARLQGDGSLKIEALLTLHGITRSTSLDVRFVGGGINPKNDIYTVGFDIRGRIRRSEFGVTTAVPLIGDEIDLIISAAFEFEKEVA